VLEEPFFHLSAGDFALYDSFRQIFGEA